MAEKMICILCGTPAKAADLYDKFEDRNRYAHKACVARYEPLIARRCFICGKAFTIKNIEDRNTPVRMDGIPSPVHRRCRGESTVRLIQNPLSAQDMSGEADKITGVNNEAYLRRLERNEGGDI